MTTIRVADPTRSQRWRTDLADRLRAWYDARGSAAGADRRLTDWDAAPGELFLLDLDGVEVGHLALTRRNDEATIVDLWVPPPLRGRGYGRDAMRHAREWATGAATRIGANLWTDDPGLTALFADFPLRSQRMIKELSAEVPLPDGIVVRSLAEDEYPDWLANEILGYADDLTDSGTYSPGEALEVSRRDHGTLLPDGLATPGQSFWMIDSTRDGAAEPVAAVWVGRDSGPTEAFVLSLEVRPTHRGRGYGKAAMLAAENRSFAAGHRYLGLNVFGHNEVAINLYRRLGYSVLDRTRAADLTQ